MSDRKTPHKKDVVSAWTEEEINRLELFFLHRMFDCDSTEAVDATVTFARYMARVKLDSDNYPIFLKLLQFENHWVVDALVGSSDPEHFFETVQPNRFIIESCFKMFTRWKPGGIYPKSILILFGLLRTAYENPLEGWKLYPLTIPDVNNLGKHLDESADQRDSVNRTILHILDRIASLADPGSLPLAEEAAQDVATQANNVRGKFLDMTKHLHEAIPTELLKRGDFRKKETAPSFGKAGDSKGKSTS
jgi:hypothetical protein